MKKLSLIFAVAMSIWALQACNSKPKDSTDAADSANAVKDTTTTGKTGIAVDADDAKFAVEAANGGMTEVELSKLAQEKAVNSKVKDFAAMMVTDHSKANDEMKALAKTKNITLPDSLNADSKKNLDDLAKKAGSDFDKAYVKIMVDDHENAVKLFENAGKNVKDPDLKSFAINTLPTLKMHQSHIKSLHDSMK